jgi:RimJ/RimL family protein N-acetyltransferase
MMERGTHKIVGSTRFANIEREHRRAEIGWTWLNPAYWRTAMNTEAKYLMLRHAFEQWKCVRVELKTHAKNTRSRTAIARLGAKEEGTLRHHMIQPDGSYRDSVYYSILDEEWPAVKKRLEERLAK